MRPKTESKTATLGLTNFLTFCRTLLLLAFANICINHSESFDITFPLSPLSLFFCFPPSPSLLTTSSIPDAMPLWFFLFGCGGCITSSLSGLYRHHHCKNPSYPCSRELV
ncbi:MAG: hypothetical protein JOS17DRAFT_117404 [Linnemannia elongata]|nr:MAG: hypothetical protein JOS17DRAFT_117404 [Linnemannia elongata]